MKLCSPWCFYEVGITGRVKLAGFHYLQCPKIGVGKRDMASKKYFE